MKRAFMVGVAWKLVFMLMVMVCATPSARAADELTVTATRHASHELGKKGKWAVVLRFNNFVFPSSVAQATKVTVGGVER